MKVRDIKDIRGTIEWVIELLETVGGPYKQRYIKEMEWADSVLAKEQKKKERKKKWK